MEKKTVHKKGRWHRVMLNTIVRRGVALDSERLRILPMGSRVLVVATLERRVQIEEPIQGWCSMKSSNGDLILTPVEENRGNKNVPATPSANSNANAKYSNFASRAEALQAEVERKDANINKWTSGLSEEQRNRVQDIRNMTEESQKEALEQKLAELQADLDKVGDHEDEIQKLASELRTRNDALKSKRIFEQMKLAASKEIENIKREYFNMFESDMDEVNSHDRLYPRDVLRFKHEGDDSLGIVKFFGKVEGQNIVGLQLSQPVGHSDGTYKGVEYFSTQKKFALFMDYDNDDRIIGKIDAGTLLLKLNGVLLKLQQMQTSNE